LESVYADALLPVDFLEEKAVSHLKIGQSVVWLTLGLLAGLSLASFWPRQHLLASSTDRNSKFALATVDVAGVGEAEGVFALDFLTGQLSGAVLDSRSNKFLTRYVHNVAADFKVDPTAEPHYAIVSGRANLPGVNLKPAAGVLYVAELTSGNVVCYSFPYQVARTQQVFPLEAIDEFPFREAVR
jgi:hypothetical protein